MAKKTRIAGFDMGTSGLKVALADPESGKIKETKTYSYVDLHKYAAGVVPMYVYEKTVEAVLKELTAEFQLVSMSVETQLYSICGIIEGTEWVYQWNSSCDAKADSSIEEKLMRSGCRLHPLFGAYKAAALSAEGRVRFKPYGLKSAMIRFLTGDLATDYSTASSIGFLDIRNLKWNGLAEEIFGVSAEKMPELYRHNQPCGLLRKTFFAGEPSSTIVVPGLGDGPSASYACKGVSRFCGNLGTSMAARVLTMNQAPADDGMFRQAVDEKRMIVGGISPNGCSIFSLKDILKPGSIRVIQNPEPLMLMPWVHGEMTPYWSEKLSPVFLANCQRADEEAVETAVTKAVAFSFATIVNEVKKITGNTDPLLLAGGGTNNQQLIKVISGCIDDEILIPENADYLAAAGATMSAAEGMGLELIPQINVRTGPANDHSSYEEYLQWKVEAEKLARIV